MNDKKKELYNKLCNSINDTKDLVIKFYKEYLTKEFSCILLLDGHLGAGKTTICKFIGELMGIDNYINSPSFNIYNIYENEKCAFLHYDLYRITILELEEMEIRELWKNSYNNKYTIHAIEWFQNAKIIESNLPLYLIQISQNINQFTERNIRIFKILDSIYEI